MAEDLAEYYREVGVRCRYMHSEIETLERIKILRGLRLGDFDVLVGINLLREGLDLPEVSTGSHPGCRQGKASCDPAILSFKPSGEPPGTVNGLALLYADRVTESMRQALDETNRRREKQLRYNRKHGITPESILKPVNTGLIAMVEADYLDLAPEQEEIEVTSPDEIEAQILKLQEKMREAARNFEFEAAAPSARPDQGLEGEGDEPALRGRRGNRGRLWSGRTGWSGRPQCPDLASL